MNENGQNGCKVFASIAKFGETKFKPIRKHEDNIIKQSTFVHSSKRTKVEENQQPKSRVNKFFKSRNPSSVLEETNKPKIVTTNITQIKNEPKFKQQDEKPLKIKIRKEKKESPKKSIEKPIKVVEKAARLIEKSTKQIEKSVKQIEKSPKQIKSVKKPEESPYVRPILKSPPAVSNQTRYSTRSRRIELTPTSESQITDRVDQIEHNESNNQIEQYEPTNRLDQHESNHQDEFDQLNEQKFVEQINFENKAIEAKIDEQIRPVVAEKKPANQYGTRKSRRNLSESFDDQNLENSKDERLDSSNELSQISNTSNIDLQENVEQMKQNCQIESGAPVTNSKNANEGLKDDFVKFFEDEDEDVSTQETNQFVEFSSFPQPAQLTSFPQKSETPPILSQPIAQEPSSSSVNQDKPVILPQKKRFFSKTDKEKKAQYNMKNFFNDANNPADELDDGEEKKVVDTKLLEYDSDKLKKVKEAHKCAELGEAEHLDGEIKFYYGGIKDKNNTNSMRCLSILGLTGQCLNKPELRMHLRAHDYMGKIIRALMDSPKEPNLAMCAACLMFVYNQGRMTMDIDPNALGLMLELLETKVDISHIEQKHREKILDFCKIMKIQGHGKYLKLNEISAGTLAMETLLGLTSKRAGDWFKEELRNLKGIDFLVDTILDASSDESNKFMQQEGELNKIDRSLRVIENVTCQNKENQHYVIDYKESSFIIRCMRLYELCKNGIIRDTTTNHYLSPLLSILRVFTNLTSDSEDGCAKVGENIPDIFDVFLNSVFELPSFVVSDSRFDLIIFLLCLCLNLIESCDQLHNNFINNESQIKRLIVMLEERYNEAKKTEQQADDFLDSEETQRQLNADAINIDSILTDLVAKSGKHMEHTIIAACISLLIGSGLRDNYNHVDSVRRLLPNNSFTILIDVITKLKEFSNLASIMTKSGIKRVESILVILKQISK